MSALGDLGEQFTDTDRPMDVEPHSDLGNMHRFLLRHGPNLRYVPEWDRWLLWDGTRWKPDTTGEVHHLAKLCARRWLRQMLDTDDSPLKKQALAWALKSESVSRLRAAVELAATDPGTVVTAETLDCDPWLLNTPGGTVDLRTGRTRGHDPADLITATSLVAPDDRPTPGFDEFLEFVQPEPDMRGYLARVLGSCLVGAQIDHVLPILTGYGQNGKSTLLNVCRRILGSYAMQGAADLLTDRPHPESVAQLEGRRLVVLAETGQRKTLNEAFVKSATGGDPIPARHLYGRPYEFAPTHTMVLATNHLPEVRGTDDGIWRRLLAVPFDVKVPDDRRDGGLPDRLVATEGPGILRWMIEGCLDWHRRGTDPPAKVRDKTSQYRRDEDHFAAFVDERILVNPHVRTSSKQVFGAYRAWCVDQGVESLRGEQVGRRLRDLGCEPRRGAQGRKEWQGLELIPDD